MLIRVIITFCNKLFVNKYAQYLYLAVLRLIL